MAAEFYFDSYHYNSVVVTYQIKFFISIRKKGLSIIVRSNYESRISQCAKKEVVEDTRHLLKYQMI